MDRIAQEARRRQAVVKLAERKGKSSAAAKCGVSLSCPPSHDLFDPHRSFPAFDGSYLLIPQMISVHNVHARLINYPFFSLLKFVIDLAVIEQIKELFKGKVIICKSILKK